MDISIIKSLQNETPPKMELCQEYHFSLLTVTSKIYQFAAEKWEEVLLK